MTLKITHGGTEPWTIHGGLCADGTIRRVHQPGSRPLSGNAWPSGSASYENPGYVLARFQLGETLAPAFLIYLEPSAVVGMHPVFYRRLSDPRRVSDPLWSWHHPIMAVIGDPTEADRAAALKLKAQMFGLT